MMSRNQRWFPTLAVTLALALLTGCTIRPVTRPPPPGEAAPAVATATPAAPAATPIAAATPATADEILARAYAAGNAIRSAAITLAQTTTYPGGALAMTCAGVSEDQQSYMTCFANDVKLEILVISPSEVYVRQAPTLLWTATPLASASDYSAAEEYAKFARNARVTGEEVVDGIGSYVVEYDIDLDQAMQNDPNSRRYFDFQASHALGRSLIGKEDFLSRRIEVEVVLAGSGGEVTQEIKREQRGFNQAVEIPEPLPRARQIMLSTQDPVFQVAFSPDGKTLAACDDDATIYLWSLADPQLGGARLIGHPETLPSSAESDGAPKLLSKDFYALNFSLDSRTLAAGSQDEVYLYSLVDPATPPTVLAATHEGAPAHDINAVAYSPDDSWLAAGGEDGVIYRWATGNLSVTAQALVGHDDAIRDLLFLPGGQTLASASADTTIRLWDMRDLTAEPAVLNGHTWTVYNLAATSDGGTLLSVGYKDPIYSWALNPPTSRPDLLIKREMPAIGKAPTLAIALAPDGRLLATADVFGQVRLWRVPNFTEPYALFGTGSQYDTQFDYTMQPGAFDEPVQLSIKTP